MLHHDLLLAARVSNLKDKVPSSIEWVRFLAES